MCSPPTSRRAGPVSARLTDATGRAVAGRAVAARAVAARARTFAALALAAAFAACGDDGPIVAPPEPVAAVQVSASATTLVVGQTATLQATLKDAAGRTLTDREVTWSSSSDAVATVTQAGQVTAVAPGTVQIGATSEDRRGEVVIEVTAPAVASVTLGTHVARLGPGDTHQLIATPRDAQGQPIAGLSVEWSVVTDGPAVALSSDGLVTALRMGTATVTATVAGKQAQATIVVLGNSNHDLLFERRAADGGGMTRPWLHRIDMRTPGAEPVLVRGPMDVSAHVAPSPDGTRIAFVCTNGGSAICVANADGSNGVLLPGFGGGSGLLADQPAWSPDGSRIAFRGWSPGGPPGIFNPADVWVMNADGSGKAKLTAAQREVDSHATPAWSPRRPDGRYRIAFAHETRAGDGFMRASIQSIRADGQDRLPVTAPGEYVDGEPTWAPDGQTIAFVRTGGTAAGDIWLVNASAGNERPLMAAGVEPAGAQRSPAWSPDGAQIAFASNHEIIGTYYAYQIYTVLANGTQVTRHTSDAAEKGGPAWIRRP